ncbi:DUF29 domain-containing protein [Jiella sp. R10]|uniref:DUF29 domain-containing protein n=1 Tax=Antarcticirhabdus aurantiaca TaxID=2606717 RepID=A0ACD4NRF4_9HYPH|nr:DUF29 domain-containing protein [Jeongeuplla avenae]
MIRKIRLFCPRLPTDIDLDNIAEEIADLGKSHLDAVHSQLRNILVHLLKAAADPGSRSLDHWRTETDGFQSELLVKYSPSMARKVEMDRTWRLAKRNAASALREHGRELPQGLPDGCPFELEAFLGEDFDFDVTLVNLVTFATAHAPR